MIPPTTAVARSQDRYEETAAAADSPLWRPYRRRGRRGLAGLSDSYWEYQALRWRLGGLGLATAGFLLLFAPGLFWGGPLLIGIGAVWTYLAFFRR